MDFDVLAAPVTPPPPRVDAVRHVADRDSDDAGRGPVGMPEAAKVITARRLELSFHEDLNVLMTRVIDAQTGDLVREFPSRQVLDLVADVMTRMRAREEG